APLACSGYGMWNSPCSTICFEIRWTPRYLMYSSGGTVARTRPQGLLLVPLNHAPFGLAERRRSRTYQPMGYIGLPVLKTGWATGPVPLHGVSKRIRWIGSRSCPEFLSGAAAPAGGQCGSDTPTTSRPTSARTAWITSAMVSAGEG